MLEAKSLLQLMCIDIDVLFSNIEVVRMWCDVMVSTAGYINNGGRVESSVARPNTRAVWTG